jgi:hypothetical protein
VSFTVTVKEQEALFPAASIALQFTVVGPFGNVEPEAGVQELLTPGQLSVAAAQLTTAEHCPASVPLVMLLHARTGASVSLMMTVNEHVAVRPDASVTVQLTVLVPTLNVEPEGGVQLELDPVQLSEMTGGSQTTFALEHWPGLAT